MSDDYRRRVRHARVMYLCGLMSGGTGLACGADGPTADEPVRSITAAATLPVGVTVSSDLLRPFWVADAAAPSSIAFVDPTYVAAFGDSRSNGIYVTRLADDGIPLDFPAVPIVVGGAPSAPIIRAVGDDAVVVWADTATMYGARVASDGQPLGDFPVVLGSDVAGTFDLVADEAGDALIVWRRSSDKAIVAVPWKANGLVEPPVVVDPSAACVAWYGGLVTAALGPSISYGAGSFLMTWMDADAETEKCALVARRMTATAEPLDSGPFVVAEPRASWDTLPQSSAFNGENHVIVWPFIRRAAGDNRVELYSIRVGVDGVVVDPNGELLATRTMDYWREPTPTIVPQAASDLVVWNEAEIHGKEISKTDGTLVIPRRVVLSSSWERPNAATNGVDTLIMSGNRVTSWSVSASGPVEGTAFVAKVADVGGGSGTGSTRTVRGPDGYRVQWEGRTGPVAALLRQDGSDGEHAYPLDPEPIASDGVGYLGARFETENDYYGPFSLLAVRFSSAGLPLDPVPIQIDIDRDSYEPRLEGAAFSDGAYLVLRQAVHYKYLEAGAAWRIGHDGHGALISDQGVPIATYDFPAEDEDHIQLAVVPSPSGFTVGWVSRVWYRCSDPNRFPICDDPNVPATDAFGPVFIRLQRVSADGSREPYVEFDGSGSWELGWAPTFTMATDGQSVLAVGLRGTDIWAQLFDEDLEKRSDPFIVASGRPYYAAVKATFTGSHYLVAWSDERNETSSGLDIYAARVLPDGESLDPTGFAVVDEPGDDLLVGAESYGDDHALLTIGARAVMISFDSAGAPCSDNSDCASGYCVDDVCCDSACGENDPSDCQVCSVAAGGEADGVCRPLPANAVCRPVISDCDAPELCDGDSSVCPVDDPAARNGATCDDENALTDNDICVDGICFGEPSNTAGAAGWSGTEGDVGTGGATTTGTGGAGTGGAGTGGAGTGGVGTGGAGTGGAGTGGAGTGGAGTGGAGTGGAGTGGVGTGGAGTGGAGTGGVGTGGAGTGGVATGTGGVGTGGAGTGGAGTGGATTGAGGVGTGGTATTATGGTGTGGATTAAGGTGTGGAGGATTATGGTGIGGTTTGGDSTGSGGHAGGGGPSCGCSVPTGTRGSWWALLAVGAAVGRRKRRPKGE